MPSDVTKTIFVLLDENLTSLLVAFSGVILNSSCLVPPLVIVIEVSPTIVIDSTGTLEVSTVTTILSDNIVGISSNYI